MLPLLSATGVGRWSEPFQFGFFRNAFVVAVLAGALCGLIGVFVVLRQLSYIGHGLSHAIFGGAAAAALLHLNFLLGAGVWAVGSGLAVGAVGRRRVVAYDAAIAVVTTAGFAFGVVAKDIDPRAGRGLEALLFGSILGVSGGDLAAIAAVGLVSVAVVAVGYRRLLFVSFDPEVAAVSGVRTERVEALLLVMLSAVIVVTMKVLGVTLIAAILVVPAATARLLTNSFSTMIWLSMSIGAVTAASGMYLSYFVDAASGATIVLVGAAGFVLALAARGRSQRKALRGLHLH
ncbi:MAG: metal ABC transporter permease [Acidimicrobiia bacterium]|nr:metal ABC transporter permease [Acidimicrobiia bacterium]